MLLVSAAFRLHNPTWGVAHCTAIVSRTKRYNHHALNLDKFKFFVVSAISVQWVCSCNDKMKCPSSLHYDDKVVSEMDPDYKITDQTESVAIISYRTSRLFACQYMGIISRSVSELIIQSRKMPVTRTCKIITPPGHNFAHVTAVKLSWYVQNCDRIWSSRSWLKQREFIKHFNHELLSPWWNVQIIRCRPIWLCQSIAIYDRITNHQ